MKTEDRRETGKRFHTSPPVEAQIAAESRAEDGTREKRRRVPESSAAAAEPACQPGMDGKNFTNEQQAQQKKPDAVTDRVPSQGQEALNLFPDSDNGNISPSNGHEADVNMEAAISTEDVIRAGGFGAKDDIGSLLPTAIDSTDFEASLRDARDFEGEKGAPAHPGLGWKGEKADDGGKPSDVAQQ